jgi:hypothetical protein
MGCFARCRREPSFGALLPAGPHCQHRTAAPRPVFCAAREEMHLIDAAECQLCGCIHHTVCPPHGLRVGGQTPVDAEWKHVETGAHKQYRPPHGTGRHHACHQFHVLVRTCHQSAVFSRVFTRLVSWMAPWSHGAYVKAPPSTSKLGVDIAEANLPQSQLHNKWLQLSCGTPVVVVLLDLHCAACRRDRGKRGCCAD